MKKQFFISDTHFGHDNILTFVDDNGDRIRPHWDDVYSMHEDMIQRWNAVVSPSDRVYHLGDVVIDKRWLDLIMPRLNGRKVLIKGNHDIFKLRDYTTHFQDIRAYKVFTKTPIGKVICSHIPIHSGSFPRWGANIHGHTHDNVVMKNGGPNLPELRHISTNKIPDDRYFNVSVENIDYTPIEYEDLMSRLEKVLK